ncbi:MAG: sugar phosphate isomerase/epimerase [Lachnospiraceae bacterium]|nr:sugar phosphate isomerase/epimerase [Lachnospiraceae bacterium]
MEIGAQFYTIRHFCETPEDFAESIKKVADIGYPTVQISGTCEFEPEWLRDQLKAAGLRCVLTHTPKKELAGDLAEVARNHDVFGCGYVGLGHYKFAGEGAHTTEEFLKTYLPVAKELKAHGKYFMYHNHAGEFARENGRVILDVLAEEVPADLMGFTLDTFWVQTGGGDPAAWLLKLAGRVPVIHLKDYAWDGERKMAVLGEGNINFDRVFEAAEQAGTEYMMVEQDDCGGEDPFACLKRSYDYLKAAGF